MADIPEVDYRVILTGEKPAVIVYRTDTNDTVGVFPIEGKGDSAMKTAEHFMAAWRAGYSSR